MSLLTQPHLFSSVFHLVLEPGYVYDRPLS